MKKLCLIVLLAILVLLTGIHGLIAEAQSDDIGRTATTLPELAAPSNYTQQARFSVTPSNGLGSGPVAVSGNTAVVYSGAGYYVYVRSGSVWSQQAILVPSDGLAVFGAFFFPRAVRIDGDTIVIGGPAATINSNANQGAAYVFVRNGAIWAEQQRLTASDGVGGNQFGNSVAISGGTIIVGAFQAAVAGAVEHGAAYVFARNGSSWSEQAKLVANDGGARNNFGKAVAIDGDTAVVTRAYRTSATIANPATYVFLRNGTIWTQQQKLSVCEPSGNGGVQCDFGTSISIDGDNLAVGNYFLNVGTNNAQGGVYIFARSGTSWSQQQRLTASDGGTDGLFGSAVSIENDTLLVGATADLGVPGSAYIFTRVGSIWAQQQKLQVNTTRDAFGQFASMSGNTLLIACPVEQAAYVFIVPAAGFEGDVAPRPDGDGAMLSTDVTQIRRFITGLDTPNPAVNEAQRADCAPRTTLGDGEINSADVVQTRRHTAGLDPLTPSGGPTAQSEELLSAVADRGFLSDMDGIVKRRSISVTSAKADSGSRVSVVVELISQEDEAAASFTLEFDASKLRNPHVALADGASESTVLTVNSNDAESGRTGILVDSTESLAKQLVTIMFDVAADAPGGETRISLTDSLASRSVSDSLGRTLYARYRDGAITVSDRSFLLFTSGSFGYYQFDNIAMGATY